MNIVHRIGVKALASKVYDALATIEGLTGWWTKHTTGSSNVGGSVAFMFHTPNGKEIGGARWTSLN